MRSEKRNRKALIFLVLFCLLSIPAVLIRVNIAATQLPMREYLRITKITTGAYYDRTGTQILKCADGASPDIVGNLFGFDNYIENSLTNVYNSRLVPASFDLTKGYQSLAAKEGSAVYTSILPVSAQETVASAFMDESTGRSYRGVVFAYNYKTGEVYTALSLPSIGDYQDPMPEETGYNKVLNGTYVPGSTMKIVALLTALEHSGIDLDTFRHTCTGVTVLPDGNSVTCGYAHGTIGIKDALGMSCNGFFCTLATQFDVSEACATLAELDFETQLHQIPELHVGELTHSKSTTVFSDPDSFHDCWGFAGQGKSTVSVITMAQLAGAIANHGEVAQPNLVRYVMDMDTGKVTDRPETVTKRFISQETAEAAHSIWTAAVEEHYTDRLIPEITLAKTGTAEQDSATSRSLVGVMEGYDTAFYIYVEGLESGNPLCFRIAEILANELEKYTD